MTLKTPDMSSCSPKKKCCWGDNKGLLYDTADPCEDNRAFDPDLCDCVGNTRWAFSGTITRSGTSVGDLGNGSWPCRLSCSSTIYLSVPAGGFAAILPSVCTNSSICSVDYNDFEDSNGFSQSGACGPSPFYWEGIGNDGGDTLANARIGLAWNTTASYTKPIASSSFFCTGAIFTAVAFNADGTYPSVSDVGNCGSAQRSSNILINTDGNPTGSDCVSGVWNSLYRLDQNDPLGAFVGVTGTWTKIDECS